MGSPFAIQSLGDLLALTVPGGGGCLLWIRSIDTKGYGESRYQGRRIRAHRLAWMLATGSEAKHCVCHKCDVRNCVNPDHLFDATQRDNILDCIAKGRRNTSAGTMGGRRKLRAENIPEIVRRHGVGEQMTVIAKTFEVDPMTIFDVVHGLSWKHIQR